MLYIDKTYSGDVASTLDIDVRFDGLNELSERYADAVFHDENDTYQITDGDI